LKPLLITLCVASSAIAEAQNVSLSEALSSARNHRSSIKSAELKVAEARHSAQAFGAYPPTVLGFGYSSRDDLGATDQDLYVAQPLDVFGRSSAARSVGIVHVKRAEAELRAEELRVQSEVMRAYFQASTATRLSGVADALSTLADSLHQAAKRRFEEGKAPEVQVTRAKIELDRARQSASLRRSQEQVALKRLAGAVGFPVSAVDAESTLAPSPLRNAENRPDILLHAADVDLALAEANYASRIALPELDLIGLRSPWRDRPAQLGVRLQLTWSILDHGRSRNEREAAQKRGEAAAAALVDVRQKAESELEAIELEVEAATERLATYRDIQGSARSLVDKSRLGYTEGYGTLVDVLEATRSLREIEQELAEARLELNLAEVARYEATGALMSGMERGR